MKPAALPWRNAAALTLVGALAAADAAPGALARASATVVEPVVVNAWLGTPASVQQWLVARDAPAGPAAGNQVLRAPDASAPPPEPRLPAAQIDAAVASRAPFAIDMMASAGLLARGPAAAVSAEDDADGETALVITVAFN